MKVRNTYIFPFPPGKRCAGRATADLTNDSRPYMGVQERAKMDITYYPNGKSSDGFEVGHIVNNMRVSWYKRNSRLMEKVRPNATRCIHCGAESGWLKGRALQAHHIKPIWAWMLEQLLRQPPQDREEGAEMALRAQWGLTKFDTHFHTPDNLLCLCKRCHEKEESKTLKRWKAYFNEHPQVSIK